MKAIVYTSNSGFTAKYAQLLSTETGLPVYALTEAGKKLDKSAEIIYLGWLMAGSIKGYKKAAQLFSVKAVCGVGMARPSEKSVSDLRTRNKITDTAVFCLRGGFDINKLHGIYRFMMKNMAKGAGSKLEAKTVKSEAELEELDMLKNGRDFVCPENLTGVLAWFHSL